MGGGIAYIVADKTDTAIRMKDINWKALAGGLKAASKIWRKQVERRRMSRGEMQRKISRVTTTTDWSGFHAADLVIEAVIENLDVKRKVLAEFEALAKDGAIFASNTSTLPITEIAARTVTTAERIAMTSLIVFIDGHPRSFYPLEASRMCHFKKRG